MPMFVILAVDSDRRDLLKELVASAFPLTSSAVQVFASAFPVEESDPVMAQMRERRPDIVIVDFPRQNMASALSTIELVHAELPQASIIAMGDMLDGQAVIGAMRSGACEFLPSSCTADDLSHSVGELRPISGQGKTLSGGRLVTVVNAKGGCGATTVAVNIAVTLQKERGGNCVLVDLAPLGHAALHLSANPSFGIATALRSLGRLDQSLVEGLITHCECGIDLLAGMESPADFDVPADGLRRLFELLTERYRYVIVDASSRLDPMLRSTCDASDLVLLVADANTLALLWSAARVQRYLAGDRSVYDKIQLVLNRFDPKFPLSDTDAEAATDAHVLWKIPSEALVVGPSVDSGVPVVLKKNSEAGKSLKGLAAAVADHLQGPRRPAAGFAERPGSTFLSYMTH
jgi:pilus assembly protein CpaE